MGNLNTQNLTRMNQFSKSNFELIFPVALALCFFSDLHR